MRKSHEVLRLKWAAQLSNREIAGATGIARSTVGDYLRRAEQAGLTWPLPEGLDHDRLEQLLFPAPPPSTKERPLPNWHDVHRELRGKGVTLWLLWEEYCAAYAGTGTHCYSYTRFCELYRAWKGTIDVYMRQTHRPGEKLFVDFAGQTVPLVDPATGEVSDAHLFVAVLGATNYTFATATEGEDLRSWIDAHQQAFRFYQGLPEILVPDSVTRNIIRTTSSRASTRPRSGLQLALPASTAD